MNRVVKAGRDGGAAARVAGENAVAAQRRVPGQVEVERGVPCGWIHKIAPPGFFVQMVCPYFLIIRFFGGIGNRIVLVSLVPWSECVV